MISYGITVAVAFALMATRLPGIRERTGHRETPILGFVAVMVMLAVAWPITAAVLFVRAMREE